MLAHVIVKMDEAMELTDTLHVLVQEGADMPVPLAASGGSREGGGGGLAGA